MGVLYSQRDPPQKSNYSVPVGERSIAISLPVCLWVSLCVCQSVCPQAYLWNRRTDFHKVFCANPLWHWLRPPWRRCDTLCTSGFMNDVMFGRNGRDAKRGSRHSATAINYVRHRGEVWCLWMPVITNVILLTLVVAMLRVVVNILLVCPVHVPTDVSNNSACTWCHDY